MFYTDFFEPLTISNHCGINFAKFGYAVTWIVLTRWTNLYISLLGAFSNLTLRITTALSTTGTAILYIAPLVQECPELLKIWHVLTPLIKTIFGHAVTQCPGLLADFYVGFCSKGKLYVQVAEVPYRRAAVVLGCGKYTQERPNLYYKYRIEATVELWQAGTIDAILVSGDNSRKDYDEPSSMKADLVEKGVPSEYITIDYAGFRTLDSVVRAEQVFGLSDYIVVSQPFHCRRAVYLANTKGQDVIGYCAPDVGGGSGVKMRLRETRAKAILDVMLSKSPKYLGKKESVHYRICIKEP